MERKIVFLASIAVESVCHVPSKKNKTPKNLLDGEGGSLGRDDRHEPGMMPFPWPKDIALLFPTDSEDILRRLQ